MPTVYPSLRMGAKIRLSIFRAEALRKDWIHPMTWRDVRFATLKSASGFSQGMNDKTQVWYAHEGGESYFRTQRDAHEVISRLERGWYTDVDATETAIGIVASLSHGRFIAGYRWDANDERVFFPEIYDDENDAARAANGHAESFADVSREDSYKYETARKLESETEDAFVRLRECIVLRHKDCMAYVRDEIAELIEKIRTNRETLRTEYADYL